MNCLKPSNLKYLTFKNVKQKSFRNKNVYVPSWIDTSISQIDVDKIVTYETVTKRYLDYFKLE